MTEETDAPEGGAEGEVAPEAVETPSEATTEQPTGTDEPGPADDAGEAIEEPVKRVPWFQKRIDEVTARKYEAEREAAYWRGLAQGQTPQAPAQQQQSAPPDRYEDPEGYDRWLVQTAVSTAKAQTVQEFRQQQVQRSYEEREAAARVAKPDFDSVVHDPTLPISPLMAEMIRESASGPDIAYHLGKNRAEAERINRLPPYRQAVELGKIEATLTKAPAAPKPIPPAPPQTVGGVSSGLAKTHEQMSYAEYKKVRDAEENNRN
jgi:hypothetical protein